MAITSTHSVLPRDPLALGLAARHPVSELVANGRTADNSVALQEEVLVEGGAGRIPVVGSVRVAGMGKLCSAYTWFESVAAR